MRSVPIGFSSRAGLYFPREGGSSMEGEGQAARVVESNWSKKAGKSCRLLFLCVPVTFCIYCHTLPSRVSDVLLPEIL